MQQSNGAKQGTDIAAGQGDLHNQCTFSLYAQPSDCAVLMVDAISLALCDTVQLFATVGAIFA